MSLLVSRCVRRRVSDDLRDGCRDWRQALRNSRTRVGGHRFRGSDDPFTHQLRRGQRVPLKTKGSRRVLEVTPSLISELRKLKLASARSSDQDFAFVNRLGKAVDHRNLTTRVLGRAIKAAGLGAVKRDGEVVVPAPVFHDLRHSHASALIAQKWDIAEVSARLDHSDITTTLKVYTHEFDAARRSDDRRSRLAALYASPVEAFVEATDGNSRGQQGTGDGPLGTDGNAEGWHPALRVPVDGIEPAWSVSPRAGLSDPTHEIRPPRWARKSVTPARF